MDVIVGTAGHIDHGKTALVKALTGIDADRLPEEKRRGITVDLGFAEMTAGDIHFGFVDVPGHERFVKNMLAGASGIDLVVLVIAADEGVMPQTREHFDICRLLEIRVGVIVLTKADLVDAETLELAQMDVAELVAGSFLENAPVVVVSARTGDGIDDLKETLRKLGRELTARTNGLVTRLPIDRSFSMKGFGTVVTGTLASGEIPEGSELELMPSGRKVRVRGLQTHSRSVTKVHCGQRVAVNLGRIDQADVSRGMMLIDPGTLRPTQMFDAEIEVLTGAPKPLRSRGRVRVHIGTAEELARVYVLNAAGEIAPGETSFAQVRLETSVIAVSGERFIIRSYSPQVTIAGGTVIDTYPPKHRRKDLPDVTRRLADLVAAKGDLLTEVRIRIRGAGGSALTFADLQAMTGSVAETLRKAIDMALAEKAIIDAGGCYVSRAALGELAGATEKAIKDFHRREPLAKGISREALRERTMAHVPEGVFEAVLSNMRSTSKIALDRDTVRLATHRTELSKEEAGVMEKLRSIFENAGLEVPKLEDALATAVSGTSYGVHQARRFFQLFLDSGEILKVSDEFFFRRDVIDQLVDRVRQFAEKGKDRGIDVPKFKEIARVSRKYAIPLLEYFDREKVTQRVGEGRIVL
jgi:selenocysteine-specific elongation factor